MLKMWSSSFGYLKIKQQKVEGFFQDNAGYYSKYERFLHMFLATLGSTEVAIGP